MSERKKGRRERKRLRDIEIEREKFIGKLVNQRERKIKTETETVR